MKQKIGISLLLSALLALVTATVAFTQNVTPEVFAADQSVVNGQVEVVRASIGQPGWVVIHADQDGGPGPVIGQSPLMAGINSGIVVDIDVDGATDTLYAMLHVDEGEEGVYEFPGADVPVTVNDQAVTEPFENLGIEELDITEVITGDGDFVTLLSALEAADLVTALQGDGPLTLFAPVDDAFGALPPEALAALLEDTEALSEVLLYHVVADELTADVIAETGSATTLQGSSIEFTVGDDGTVMVNNAVVDNANIPASNGVIHAIESVLLPPDFDIEAYMPMTETEEMTDGMEMTETEEITDGMEMTETEEMTDGMEMTETDEMTDGMEMTETGEMTAAEEMTDGTEMTDSMEMTDDMEMTGTEEMTDSMEMTDGMEMTDTGEMTAAEEMTDGMEMTDTTDMDAMEPMSNLVEVALANEGFSTLVTALSEAGLVEALQGEGPFTVFAPNDDAFAKIPDDQLDALLADPQGDLTDILLYHVVSGEIMSADIEDGQTVETLQGAPITVSLDGDQVLINNAVVVQRDLVASNGVIHVVDTVLMPPGMADEEMDDAADEDAADEDMADEDMADEDMADEDMADEDMADEDMADEDMADEDMADEDMADEDMADEDMADEDMAQPGTLPETGVAPSPIATMGIVVLVLALLFGSTLLMRREEA